MPLADRNTFQMDKTKSENKIILWHLRKCIKDTDMDSCQRLRTDRYYQKRLDLELSFYTILQIFSVTVFEQLPIIQALTDINIETQMTNACNQLVLFDL